jgi:hypothetical protein
LDLDNKSFKLGVLKTYIPKFEKLLVTKFIKYLVDWKHQLFNPRLKDVKGFWGYSSVLVSFVGTVGVFNFDYLLFHYFL